MGVVWGRGRPARSGHGVGLRGISGERQRDLAAPSRHVLEKKRKHLKVRCQCGDAPRHASYDGGPHGHVGKVGVGAERAEPRRRRCRSDFAVGHHRFKTAGAWHRLTAARVEPMDVVTDPTTHTVDAYLVDLASPSPTPGGGSAAGMIGALAAALVAMVARLTVGRPAFETVDADARRLVNMADDARQQLLEAMAADEAAFRDVMAAFRLPREGEVHRVARREAISRASRAATTPPLRAARAARVVLDLALEAAQIGNPTVTSDAAVAAWAACAAIRASAINVRVNLPGVRDPAFAERCESELGALVRDAIALAEEVERVSGRPT